MYRVIEESELKVDKTLGYVYFLDKKHPLASADVGRVYYHRHVASIANQRWLTPAEVVHHIDGDKSNNNPSNLLVLTNSDHALLHKKQDGFDIGYKDLICPVCEKHFFVLNSSSHKRVTCSVSCAKKKSFKWNISKNELELLIWNMSYTDISKKYSISDTGVKKKAKSLGCLMPPPYFFSKTEEYRREQRRINNISDLSL